MRKLNPRYVCYARAHGKTPEEMLECDTEQWPGGKMAGFIAWNSEMVGRFRKKHGLLDYGAGKLLVLPDIQVEYGKFLEEQTR